LRTAAGAADLAILAYQVSSVTGQLAQLDDALAQRLLDPEAFAMPGLSKIGELLLVRRELAGQLPQMLALEMLALIAAGSWVPVRKLMISRGFLSDVETALGADEDDGQ
jgi:hypothetical protein